MISMISWPDERRRAGDAAEVHVAGQHDDRLRRVEERAHERRVLREVREIPVGDVAADARGALEQRLADAQYSGRLEIRDPRDDLAHVVRPEERRALRGPCDSRVGDQNVEIAHRERPDDAGGVGGLKRAVQALGEIPPLVAAGGRERVDAERRERRVVPELVVVGREQIRSAREQMLVALTIARLPPRRRVVGEKNLREPLFRVRDQELEERRVEIDLVAAEQREIRREAVGDREERAARSCRSCPRRRRSTSRA